MLIMISVDSFLRTLKQIGYPEADSLDDSDLNSLISDEGLKSFFEVFCTLDENNVLTTEEIEEYSALTSSELAEIEVLKKSCQFENNDTKHEKRKESYYLHEHLTQIENQNKALEEQIDLFKKHEENLLQEKETQQKFLLNAKKRFKIYELSRIPVAEKEFVSSVNSTLEAVQDLESIIKHFDDNKLPTSNFLMDLVQQYLEAENKILQSINAYMQTSFQLQEKDTLAFIRSEKVLNKELEKEALVLKKKLKSSMIINAISEMETCKIKSMINFFEMATVSDINCPVPQIRHKLDDAMKLNEHLKKKEEEYKTYLSDTISKHVDALVAEVALCATNETFNNLQIISHKISIPKNYLIRQRLRLEMLIAFICEQKSKFHDLKELIQELLKLMEKELFSLQERQKCIEKELSHVAEKEDEGHPENAVFSHLNEILANFEGCQVQDISVSALTDVVQKACKFHEIERNLKTKHEDKIKTLDEIETYAYSMESLLCAENKYSSWQELEQSLNANLNNLVMKLIVLEENISKCNNHLDQKQKLLEKKRNLQLARHLYVYALMNRELFTKCIDDIKVAIENSPNYNS